VIALDDAAGGSRHWHYDVIFGGIIGAFVGVPIWGLLGYMVYRKKNAAPNEIIPDDTST
jgi:membrane-associated phospholipid phosphatase